VISGWTGLETQVETTTRVACLGHTRVSGLKLPAAPTSDNGTQQFPDSGSEGLAPLLLAEAFSFRVTDEETNHP
jgi:hypothetical protein